MGIVVEKRKEIERDWLVPSLLFPLQRLQTSGPVAELAFLSVGGDSEVRGAAEGKAVTHSGEGP